MVMRWAQGGFFKGNNRAVSSVSAALECVYHSYIGPCFLLFYGLSNELRSVHEDVTAFDFILTAVLTHGAFHFTDRLF